MSNDDFALNGKNISGEKEQKNIDPNDLDIALTPHEVDFFPPLVHSFSTFFSILGKQVSCNALYAALGNSPASAASCQRAAKTLGMNSRIVHRDKITDIVSVVLPCLLLLKNNQSCILLSYEEQEAEVILPEHGHNSCKVDLEKLSQLFSGYVIFASLEAKVDKRVNKIAQVDIKRWFWDVVLHYMPLYRQVIWASIAINILVLIGPLFFMNVYDRVVPNLAYETLWVLAIGVLAGYLFEFFLKVLRSNFTDRANKNINTVISTMLMQKVMGMQLEDRPESSGALISQIKDFDSIQEFFSAVTLLTVIDLPFTILFLFVVFLIGGVVVVLPIIAMIVLLVIVLLMQYSVRRFSLINHQGNVEKNAHLVEMISGIESIKMAVAENRMLQIWEKVVGYTADTSTEAKKINTLAVNISVFITHIVSIALIVWGVYLIGAGLFTTGALIACNILIGRSMSFISQAAGLMTRYQQTQIALKMLNQLMSLPSEREQVDALVDFGSLAHSIEFTHVTFSYKNSTLPVITDMNLLIKPGEKVGIIGNMGSGKSTMSRLMCGLYNPTQGAVKFGGVDLRRLDMAELRTRISFMPQDPVLFHGTVRENIALGSIHIPDQLVLRAAWISGVTDFVRNTPDGFAMHVGEKGQNLSGGQKQAVALGRALLHDPDILILDEPTSNIDGATEAKIKARLRKVLGKKTLIINMHRMSLLDLTERLIVIQDGKIIADGPTKEVYNRINNIKTAPQAEK